MLKSSKFILIEGTDGSGKGTQVGLLRRALKRQGYKVEVIDFPQYNKPSAYFVAKYLNGGYGTSVEVGAYRASLFYALDRYDVVPQIKKYLTEGKIVIANRLTLSSAAHQGGKIKSSRERKNFWRWLFDLEYNLLGIPRPNLTIVLHMPAKVAQKLVDKKAARRYLKKGKRDIHEADIKHLKAAEKTYLELAKLQKAQLVECVEKGQLLTPNEIHNKIIKIIHKNKIIK